MEGPDLFSSGGFDAQRSVKLDGIETADQARKHALQGSPAEKTEFFSTVHIGTPQYSAALGFILAMIKRVSRTRSPGGLWLIGDGGTGKTLILKKVLELFPPVDTGGAWIVPVLVLSLDEKTSESSILISMLLQLGQDPELLRYRDNADLREQVIDALKTCQTQAILFDESQNIWLTTKGNVRSADRSGGAVGGFLKRFYDRTGVAMIFAGTLGLEKVLRLNDKQSTTRWSAEIRLQEFQFDKTFIGVLNALDEAIPLPELSGLGNLDCATKIFSATLGNFRAIKRFLAEAIFLAAESNSPSITDRHLHDAFINIFGLKENPFAYEDTQSSASGSATQA